jgi:hypothetical protein
MKVKAYKTVNKSKWSRGPWDNEPDKVQYTDPDTGLPCLIVRHPTCGQLCGYVGITEGHPDFEKDYDSVAAEVHGGLTFSSFCQEETSEVFLKWNASMKARTEEALRYPQGDAAHDWEQMGHLVDDYEAWREYHEASAICHTVEPGDNKRVWWLGFDCAHCYDLSPGLRRMLDEHGVGSRLRDETYRDIEFVKAEIASLAKQLKSRDVGPLKKFWMNFKWQARKAMEVFRRAKA